MSPDELIHSARQEAGLSLSALAVRVGIPDSELAAYETGTEIPDPGTLDWIMCCATFDPGEELAALLQLGEQFPARYSPTLQYPVFGR